VRSFYNSLLPGGHLYIGHSETLHGVSKAFRLVYFKNALVYQKEAVGASTTPADTTTTSAGDAAVGAKRAIDLLSKIRPVAVGK
jgi:hypothetical protein